MEINIQDTAKQMGALAAKQGAELIRKALSAKGHASIIVATGTSQFETLSCLIRENDIDWSKITGFHLDEYVGISEAHPASFRRYLRERFVERLPTPLRAFHYVQADISTPLAECQRLSGLIQEHDIDVAFVGIGENAHLAFNDPPADFETSEPYIVVNLDELCRRQQYGEGWFPSLESVPKQAISMSIHQILKSDAIIVSCPDERKAEAVQRTVEGPISENVPASALRRHSACKLYLDKASACKLGEIAT